MSINKLALTSQTYRLHLIKLSTVELQTFSSNTDLSSRYFKPAYARTLLNLSTYLQNELKHILKDDYASHTLSKQITKLQRTLRTLKRSC